MKNKFLKLIIFLILFQNCLADGELDPTFDGDGKVTTNFGVGTNAVINGIALDRQRNIVAVGTFAPAGIGNPNYILARYTPSGALDLTFNPSNGFVLNTYGGAGSSTGNDLAIQSDGKIIIAGSNASGTSSFDFAVARFHGTDGGGTPGTLDMSFGSSGVTITDLGLLGNQDIPNAVAIASDGSIFLAGQSTDNTGTFSAVAKYDTGGTLDTSFNGSVTPGFFIMSLTGFNFEQINDILIQQDGHVLVVGTAQMGLTRNYFLARFSQSGLFDLTIMDNFGDESTFFSAANALIIQNVNGIDKIVIVGNVQNKISGDIQVAAARYNLDGTLDTSFGTGGKMIYNVSGDATSVAVQPDGKLVFSITAQIEGNNQFGVMRANADGSLDTTFGIGGVVIVNFEGFTFGFANDILIQQDLKIVVAGSANLSGQGVNSSDFALARLLIGTIPNTCTLPQDLLTQAIIAKYGNL